MLRNDQSFWTPASHSEAARLSWSRSEGSLDTLLSHSTMRWAEITTSLRAAEVARPYGHVIEFGSGMGLMDKILGPEVTKLTMVDHTENYLSVRGESVSARCDFVRFDRQGLRALQANAAYDWFISMAVFYHVDTAAAVALLLEFSKTLKPGGYAMVYGWDETCRQYLRNDTFARIFEPYPHYSITMDEVSRAVSPDLIEIHRSMAWPHVVFRRSGGQHDQ